MLAPSISLGDNTYIEGTHTHDSDSGKEIMTAAETKIEEEHKGFFGTQT